MEPANLPEMPPIPVSQMQPAFAPQSLGWFNRSACRKARPDWQAPLRRFIVFGGALGITVYLVRELYLVLSVGSIAGLETVLLILFAINIFWLALSFMTALAGFAVIGLGMRRSLVRAKDYDPAVPLTGKTAILVCTCGEDPPRVFGMAVATMRSIAKLNQQEHFDVFILSDTTDTDIWVREEAVFLAIREREELGSRIYYRRRPANTGGKPANIADWCRRWGSNYDYMLVVNAGGLMTGEFAVKLAAIVEGNPDFGLVQTAPVPIGGNTLFARLQQFASRLYGPVQATGFSFWHRGVSNFSGYNAIIRTRAFIESAGLPPLPGKPPLGGEILRHNFVEAAFLSRAGWSVCMVPDLEGSYEQVPPDLIDFAARDRRGAQGSLQLLRVLFAKGLHWVSRVHMAMAITTYVSALFWVLFLVSALILMLQSIYTVPQYFGSFPHFPVWPLQDSERFLQLLLLTLGVLLMPRLFAYLLALANSRKRRGFGGVLKLTAGVAIETIFASLIAPIILILRSSAIAAVFWGRDSAWEPQRRDSSPRPASGIMRFHLKHMAVGAGIAALTLYSSFTLFLWTLPASLGLILSGPLSAWLSGKSAGEAFRRLGLLQTEEENTPPAIAQDATAVQKGLEEAVSECEAITQLAKSGKLRRLHRQLVRMQPISLGSSISPNLVIGRAKLEVSADLTELLILLKPGEKAALLSDAESLARLEALLPSNAP